MFLFSPTNRAMIRIQRLITTQRWLRVPRIVCGASNMCLLTSKHQENNNKQKNRGYSSGSFLPVVALGLIVNCSSSDDNTNENAKSGM